MVKEYKHMDFPWISKSKLKARGYCDYSFYLKYKKKVKEPRREDSIEGTNLHMVFANFFRHLKPEHVFRDNMTDPRIDTQFHPFRKFVYEASMQFVKPNHREWGKYKNIISNFATIETERWLRLNSILKDNKGEIFDCFKPLHIEKSLYHEPTNLFGTIDRINVEVMPDHSKKIAIYDYKTGKVPKPIMDRTDVGKMYDWKLRPDLMREIHFYGLLYLLCSGWELNDNVLSILNDEKNWFVKGDEMTYKETLKQKGKDLTKLGDDYKLFKNGKMLNKGDIIVGYYFLNGDRGYRPIKEYNYSTHKSVLTSVNDFRTIWSNNYFVKHPAYIYDKDKCGYKNCSRIKMCEKEVEEFLTAKKDKIVN